MRKAKKQKMVLGALAVGAVAACWAVETAAAPQRYTPVPGGFAIRNGKAEFTRPLYGWHGDDDYRHPRKTIHFTGDRPMVRCSTFQGMRVQPVKGPEFKLGPVSGVNSVFTSFYDQLPKEVVVPLAGKASELKSLRFSCRGTETLAGLLAATLYL